MGGEVCTVDELYVAQHARGAGIGSGLIKGLVDGSLPWFKKAVALELEVTPSNTRARALYERMRAVNDRRPTAPGPTHDWPHREERGTTSSFRVARAAEPPVPPLRGGEPKFHDALEMMPGQGRAGDGFAPAQRGCWGFCGADSGYFAAFSIAASRAVAVSDGGENELGGEVCTVDELYVAQHARGAGIGSGLIKGLVDGSLPWFKKAVALELEVTPSNTRARALYERMGFRLRKNASLRLLRF